MFTVINSAVEASAPFDHQKKGFLLDASSAGIGLLTSAPLEPGNYVELSISGARRSGVVMWTLNIKSEYRVGVRFLGAETPQEAAIL
jgi:hypothetical protein